MVNKLTKQFSTALLALSVLLLAPAAKAELANFTVTWEPQNFTGDTPSGGNAVATFTLDTKYINRSADMSPDDFLSMDKVSNFELTVQGVTVGNGKFYASDFSSINITSHFPLTFNGELLGQHSATAAWDEPPFGLCNSGRCGSFNLNSINPAAPAALMPFIFFANGEPEEGKIVVPMQVTSIIATSVVPEPSTTMLLLLGIGATGYLARRKIHEQQNFRI